VHVTATGDNCCAHGDRIPGVWFHPGNRILHIRDGDADDGSASPRRCSHYVVPPPLPVFFISVSLQ
jgi:hypothetical protein